MFVPKASNSQKFDRIVWSLIKYFQHHRKDTLSPLEMFVR
jgi:hypothetical protein